MQKSKHEVQVGYFGNYTFTDQPPANWIRDLYEDLINDHYHELDKLDGFHWVQQWELSNF